MISLILTFLVGILIAVAICVHAVLNSKPVPFIIAVAAGASFTIIGVLFQSYTIVSAGHTGVQVTMGTVNPVPLTEGFHFVNPISTVKDVDMRLQRATLQGANASTKDLQVVHTDIVVNYRLNANQTAHIYKDFGLNLDDKLLGPAINESFKSVTAHFNSEELITKRDVVSAEIKQELQDKVGKYGIDVSEISLVNFGFSPEYQKSIEAKVIATQEKLKAEQDLQRIQVEAKSRIAQAEGEAKAIAIQAAAIQTNGGEQYVRLQAIDKWDGKLPTYMGGSGPVPFVSVK
jgi:regulator of protease activity HflC (stomatin/prohibitin superfamily)